MSDNGIDHIRTKREPLFDVVKALMMVWVIWGHLGLYGIVPPYSSPFPYMVNAKIGVNMPVFFVISGYFAAFTFAKSSFAKCFARSICMIWPQIVYSACAAFVAIILIGDSFLDTFYHVMSFWYLRCIAVIYLFSAVVFRAFKTDRNRWLGFAFGYILLLFWPSLFSVWWMGQLVHMLPYFVFGLMVLSKHPFFRLNWAGVLCGIFFVSVVLLEGNSDVNGMNFWKVTAHWRVVFFHVRDFVTFFARTAVGIAGSVFVLWLVDKGLKMVPPLARLAVFGTTSLGVYVIHEWIIQKAGCRFALFPLPEWTRWGVAIIYFLICHFVIVLIRSNNWGSKLLFGDEKLIVRLVDKFFKKEGDR